MLCCDFHCVNLLYALLGTAAAQLIDDKVFSRPESFCSVLFIYIKIQTHTQTINNTNCSGWTNKAHSRRKHRIGHIKNYNYLAKYFIYLSNQKLQFFHDAFVASPPSWLFAYFIRMNLDSNEIDKQNMQCCN